MYVCLLCAVEPASVLVPVTGEKGDAFALPASTPLGATCLALFEAGQDAALAETLSEEFEDFGRAKVVARLRRRAGEPVAVPQVRDSEDEARPRGFVPLAEHTGVGADLGPLWPARHRISRDDLGERGDDPDNLWLVRSPWAPLSVADVIRLLWQCVEREPYPTDDGAWSTRVLEFFNLNEDEVRRLL
jgi:hypothetical protein